jgi:aryl-alcohol dehydrogenase-like predicted oxidoreductase
MSYTTLGKTGLRTSVAGLGCGGFSRLGQAQGKSVSESVDVVRAAYDMGINLFDTAEVYGTEEIVGKAIASSERDGVVISTKARINSAEELIRPEDVVKSLHASLKRLKMDSVDIFHLHGVAPKYADYVLDGITEALLREREAGRIKHLAVSETAPNDHQHTAIAKFVESGHYDVVMVAFHLLHQNARSKVFPLTQANGVGTLLMFAVRLIFSQPERLRATLEELAGAGELPATLLDDPEPMAFLTEQDGPAGIMDAAYRYARHEPGVDVVLLGTGSQEHLRTNVQSILGDPLSTDAVRLAEQRFGHLVGVGLDAPRNVLKS